MISKIFGFSDTEKTLLEVRRHWFFFVGQIFAIVVLMVLPAVFLYGFARLPALPLDVSFAGAGVNLVQFFYSIWLLLLLVAFFVQWTDYYLDVMIITNERIIDVDQKGIFHREVSTLRYENIQDITIEVKGVIETLLNFGDLQVQTAGHERRIIIRDAQQPDTVKKLILEQQVRVLSEKK